MDFGRILDDAIGALLFLGMVFGVGFCLTVWGVFYLVHHLSIVWHP